MVLENGQIKQGSLAPHRAGKARSTRMWKRLKTYMERSSR